MAKYLFSPYLPGKRSRNWLKIKPKDVARVSTSCSSGLPLRMFPFHRNCALRHRQPVERPERLHRFRRQSIELLDFGEVFFAEDAIDAASPNATATRTES